MVERGADPEVAAWRKSLLKTLEIEPNRAMAWYALGMLDTEANEVAQAVGSFRRAVRTDPNNAAAYQALGEALQQQGKEGEAKQAMRMANRIITGAFTPPAADGSRVPLPPPQSVQEFEKRITPDANSEKLHDALAAAVSAT